MRERDANESGDKTRTQHAGECCRRSAGQSERGGLHLIADLIRRCPHGERQDAASCATDEKGDAQRCNETDEQYHLELPERYERLLAVANWRADEKG